MTRQVVITEKASQANDVRAAVGSRYGAILAAEGHLSDLCEPEDVNPASKRRTAAMRKFAASIAKRKGIKSHRPAIRSRRRFAGRFSTHMPPGGIRGRTKSFRTAGRPLQRCLRSPKRPVA